jgi:hypothetical protein
VFLTDLQMRVLSPRDWSGRKWELTAPLEFRSERFGGVFVAPCGFRTDLASIPRGLWAIYPPDGPWLRAAVMHDAGYAKRLMTQAGVRVHLVKRYVDELFGEAMACDGVPAHRIRLFLAMVGLFGQAAPDVVKG